MAEKAIGVGLIGCGTVGGGVAQLLAKHGELYQQRCGRAVKLCRLLERDTAKAIETKGVDAAIVTDDEEAFFATEDMSIVVELVGGCGKVSDLVRRALRSSRHVVTANKSLLAAEGVELFTLARAHGVSIGFEASCAGGIPVIIALQFGLMANRNAGLYGILNGTCNYILTEMTRAGKTYAQALAEAQAAGFAEADPTLDVGGHDSAQKLAILGSLAFGVAISGEQVSATGIDQLQLEDIRFGAELGYDVKLLAIAECQVGQDAVSAAVEPCFIHNNELLAQVTGAFNALSVYGDATGHSLYYGAGAGRWPTAGAVVSDILNIAGGWYPTAFAQMNLTPDKHPPVDLLDADKRISRFYLRLEALDVPGVIAKVTTILGAAGISLSAVSQHESAVGQFVPVVVITHDAGQGDLYRAVEAIEQLDQIEGRPVVIRIVDMPS